MGDFNADADPDLVTADFYADTVSVLLGTPAPAPGFSVDPASKAYDTQLVDTSSVPETFTVTNTGTAALDITRATLAGADPGEFSKSADTCTGADLAPAATCTVRVSFAPGSAGVKAAVLRFTHNATTSPDDVSLTGTGTRAATETTIAATPNPAELGDPVTFTATVTSSVGTPTGAAGFTADDSPIVGCEEVTVTDGQASCTTTALGLADHTVEATYTGDASHAPSFASVIQTVTKAATTLTAAPAFRILPRFRATLTRTAAGSPIVGRTVSFRMGDRTMCTATTGVNGVASCGALALVLGTPSYTASFAGDAGLQATSATGTFR